MFWLGCAYSCLAYPGVCFPIWYFRIVLMCLTSALLRNLNVCRYSDAAAFKLYLTCRDWCIKNSIPLGADESEYMLQWYVKPYIRIIFHKIPYLDVSIFIQVEHLHLCSSANGFWVKFFTVQATQTKHTRWLRVCLDKENKCMHPWEVLSEGRTLV